MHRHDAKLLARTLVLRVIEQRALRVAALDGIKNPPWKRLHKAADTNAPKLEAHVKAAFAKAMKGYKPVTEGDTNGLQLQMDKMLERLEEELEDGLVDLLLKTVQAGGQAAARDFSQARYRKAAESRALGDVPGHEFHGNQWTDAHTLKDKSGKPLKVYHGSISRDVNPEELDPTREPVRPRPGQLTGVYFTSDPQAASNYTRAPGVGIKTRPGKVVAANIRMRNPLDITKAVKEGQRKGLSFGDAKRNALKAVTPGHDGVIFRGDSYNADEYMVFRKEQIVRTAGDVPGHEFHGNQYTDYYHGTLASNLKGIRSQGLKADPGKKTYSETKKGRVYLADSSHEAMYWAREAGLMKDADNPEKTAVIRVRVPNEYRNKIKADPNPQGGSGQVEFHGDIPAAWIKEIRSGKVTRGMPLDVTTLRKVRTLGDVEGHAFHGNQHTSGGFTSQRPLAHSKWSKLSADPDYLYHATSMENVHDIAASVLGTHGPDFGTDQSEWPDRSTESRSYFTDKPSSAWSFAPEEGKPALLRVKRKSGKFKVESGTGDHYTTQPLTPDQLEGVTESGEWVPIKIARMLGDHPGHEFRGNQWTNASHATATDISGGKNDLRLKEYTAYHVTKRENADKILVEGFKLDKVKPRWVNDYAVSLSRGEQKARDYFSKRDPKTGKPVGMDEEKYSLLEVKFKGRLFKGDSFEQPVSNTFIRSPQEYNREMIAKGYDGHDQSSVIYLHNTRAIKSIRRVANPKARTLGDVEGHEFHGNQWTDGKPVAISEHLSKHKGMEMVSVEDLIKLRNEDRRVAPKGEYNITEPTQTLLPRLTKELKEGGAIQEPLTVAYDTVSGRAILMDGNTRLAAIEDAGFTHAPVVISRQSLHGFGREVPPLTKEQAGISPFRNWLLPSEAGFKTLKKKEPRTLGDVAGHEFHGNQWTDSSGSSSSKRTPEERVKIVEIRAESVAREMGVDPSIIHVVDQDPREFVVGNQQFQEAGHFNPSTGQIEINARNSYDDRMSVTMGVAAHEVSHAIYQDVQKRQGAEHIAIRNLPDEEFSRLFKRNGYARPEAAEELTQRYPASMMWAKTWGDPFIADENIRNKMVSENGHSNYAKSYWQPEALAKPYGLDNAVNETLAEVNRYLVSPASWSSEDSPPPKVTSPWVKLAKGMRKVYEDKK